MKHRFILIAVLTCFIAANPFKCLAGDKIESERDSIFNTFETVTEPSDSIETNADSLAISLSLGENKKRVQPESIYALPYSVTGKSQDWRRLWINTATLATAYVGTLLVLECLPENSTSWNRAEIREVAPFKRWFRNIFKRGPEWDHDKFYFNFILHPYAGSVYFMGARSCGFNMWQSLLYCTCVSTIGWEFGVEAFNERPSYQDLFITPLVGSAIGEGFYNIKRYIASHNYRLLGSKVLGNVVAFLVDPLNEFIGYFAGNSARHINDKSISHEMSLSPVLSPSVKGFALTTTF
jgi:hypothetical protein